MNPEPGPAPWAPRALRILSRVLFAAALLSLAAVVVQRRSAPSGPPPVFRMTGVKLDWTRERFVPWVSAEESIEVSRPERFDVVRGFGRFTSRTLERGIYQEDLVAFRSLEPRGVITVAVYRSPKLLSWESWKALCRPPAEIRPTPLGTPGPFWAEFGGSRHRLWDTVLEGRPALSVTAEGAVQTPVRGDERIEPWRFESVFSASGRRAVRLTVGIHRDQYAGARPGMERVLLSFRWRPGANAPDNATDQSATLKSPNSAR